MTWDRALRVVLGLFVLSLIFWGPKSLWGLVGLLPLTTGLAGRCPSLPLPGAKSCATPPGGRTA
jgi:Inner membrane protein YgaP-like, transmembrane domain